MGCANPLQSTDRLGHTWRKTVNCTNTRQNPTASSHSISRVLRKATDNHQCRISSINSRASTALLRRNSNGGSHLRGSMARRRLISMVLLLRRDSMALLPLNNNSSGVSRLRRKDSMVLHLPVSTARLLKDSMEHRPRKDSTGHRLRRDSTERLLHSSNTVLRRKDSTKHLPSSSNMDLQTSRLLDTGPSRPPTSMYLEMSNSFVRR